MLNPVMKWALLWWVTDGLGLMLWSRRVRSRALLSYGAAELVYGAAAMLAMPLAAGPGLLCAVLLIPCAVLLILLRRRVAPRSDSRGWVKEWTLIGRPVIWPERYNAQVAAMLLASMLAQLAARECLSNVTCGLLSWVVASVVAAWTSPGCFGLAANPATRWVLRCSTILCFVAALSLTAVQCLT